MAARPTRVQEDAIRSAISHNRTGLQANYSDRTIATMERNGWITRPGDGTYRVTAKAAYALGMFTVGDSYRHDDAMASNPKAQRQATVISDAAEAGVTAYAPAHEVDTVTISVEDLEKLLRAASTLTGARTI